MRNETSETNVLDLFKNQNLVTSNFTDETDYGEVEKKLRKTLEQIKGSSYVDTFDWSIYDKIADRFKAAPPRGGVIFNTTFKLVNHHSTCRKCHYSFEIDTYGRGCIHNCTYCYAKDQLTRHGYWNNPIPFPVNMAEIRKTFYKVFETDKPNKWRDVLEKRIPIRIGSMSDSFMWVDRKYKVTQELLKILRHYDYPYIIFTRSDLIATDEYMSLLDEKLASIQFSMCGGNEELTRKIEPGAPGVQRRFEAVKVLSENGFWTTVRVNPLFPDRPDGYYSDKESVLKKFGSEEAIPQFDLFNLEFIDQLREYKVPSMLAGFVRLSPHAIKAMSDSCGVNLRSFFSEKMWALDGDKRFSDREIFHYYKAIKDRCEKNGIRFSTCYIGNGEKDYYQYQDLWSNKGDCCDARGNVEKIQTSSQQISWEKRIKQASCKDDAIQSQKDEIKVAKEFSKVVWKNRKYYPKDSFGYETDDLI